MRRTILNVTILFKVIKFIEKVKITIPKPTQPTPPNASPTTPSFKYKVQSALLNCRHPLRPIYPDVQVNQISKSSMVLKMHIMHVHAHMIYYVANQNVCTCIMEANVDTETSSDLRIRVRVLHVSMFCYWL